MTLDLKAVEALEEMMSILKMTRASTEWLETQDRYEEALDKAAPELLALAKEAFAARAWLQAEGREQSGRALQAWEALVTGHQSGGVV